MRALGRLLPLSALARAALPPPAVSQQRRGQYYRADGVRITHDPYAPGMADKYGAPGKTNSEGFDPYADTVGAGIYGGGVKRNELGSVIIGQQYQNHNPRPGPVYTGGGYTPANEALESTQRLEALLDRFPDLANDVSTGGATPLHMCGMSQRNQMATSILIRRGSDIEALDTYGFTPLHRMASNNLAQGARALLEAGADPYAKGNVGETPMAIARSGGAQDVMRVLQEFKTRRTTSRISRVTVMNAGVEAVNGDYEPRELTEIPEKFALVCEQNGWDTVAMWKQLAGVGSGTEADGPLQWFEAPNKSYIYFNVGDQHWWIDGPDGLGAYKSRGPRFAVPAYPRGSGGAYGWWALSDADTSQPVPTLLVYRTAQAAGKQEM